MQLDHLLRSVLPVILLIAFGFWLQRRRFFSEEAVDNLTKLVSDYLIPCTIFTTFMGLDLRPEHFGLAACVFLIQLLLLGAGFLTAGLFGFHRRFASLYPCAFAFGFMAIPLFSTVFGLEHMGTLTSMGVGHELFIGLVFMPLARLYLKGEGASLRQIGRNLLSPLFLMIFLALVLQLSGLRELGYTVERMKGWGINNRTLYRRAMSIQHRMERIRKTEKPQKERTMKASFGEKDFSGDVVFKMKGVSKSFGDRTLFSDVNLNVEAGERIALLGDNGTGKSTFIKCLLGEEDCQGKIQFGPTVKWGYLPQIIHFDHPERSLYDTMLYEKNCTPQVARDRLGAFLFQGEDVFKQVKNLSGGEQSRLRLCMLMDEKINLLILDEPTNHLDIASREWVEAAIEEFEGVLLFVSHDRYFIEKFAERIWLLEDGTIRDFPCGYQKYRSILAHEAAAKPETPQAPKVKKEKPKGGTKDTEKLVRRLEREIEKQEALVAQLDKKIEESASDYQQLTQVLEEKETAEAVLMELMEQWEAAQE